jgi:hypothetical protein
MRNTMKPALIECFKCRCWREQLTWGYLPEDIKDKLRRRIARHKHAIRFLDREEYKREMRKLPVPASLLAHMPGLERAQ